MPPRPLPDAPKPLPHPAEDLSEDDDLLSWILVDQLGCLPNTKLGVHPQQVKFVGPVFKTDEVLNIVRETVTTGNTPAAMQRLQEFHLIKKHLDSKETESQKERFLQHLRRYLLPLQPQSRIDMHVTARYTAVTGHVELGVFATRPLSHGVVLTELQGSVVPLPDEWRAEMDLSDEFALRTTGEEVGSDDEDDEQERQASRKDKGKSKENEEDGPKGHRRSKRTGRRDFSIVWSGLKNCFQLFLGPARFLNHDCSPNVELLRQGKYVTFRVTKPIKIGEELTTFYGDDYFGKGNRECLCLTCEINHRGGFTPKEPLSRSNSRDMSAGPSSVRSTPARSVKTNGHSSLRNVFTNGESSNGNASDDDAAPSQADAQAVGDMASVAESSHTPVRNSTVPNVVTPSVRDTDTAASDDDDSDSPEATRRGPSARLAAKNFVPGYFARPSRGKKASDSEAATEVTPGTTEFPTDYPRCVTCCRPLEEQIWFNNKYFDHCSRCIRHALIFGLPWPAHKPTEVQEFPPAHLVPPGYLPKKVSSVPLPSLDKNRKKEPEIVLPPQNETREERYARKLAHLWAQEDFIVDSMREEEWVTQETRQINAAAALQAKLEAKAAKEEEKRKREENKIKGSGVWSRYEYVTEEEIARRIAERTTVVTSGKRRSGIYRRDPQEDSKEAKAAVPVAAAVQIGEEHAKPTAAPAQAQQPLKQSPAPATGNSKDSRDASMPSSRGAAGPSRVIDLTGDDDDIVPISSPAHVPKGRKRSTRLVDDTAEQANNDSSNTQKTDTSRLQSDVPPQRSQAVPEQPPVVAKAAASTPDNRPSITPKEPTPTSGRPGAVPASASSSSANRVHIPTSARPSTVSASTPFSFKPIRPMPSIRPAPIVITAPARPTAPSPKPLTAAQEPVKATSPLIPAYLSRFRGMGAISKPTATAEPTQAQRNPVGTNTASRMVPNNIPSAPPQALAGRTVTTASSTAPKSTSACLPAQTPPGRPATTVSSTVPKSVIASSPAQTLSGRTVTTATITAPKSAIASSPAQSLSGRPMTPASSTAPKSVIASSPAQTLSGRTVTTATITAPKSAIASSPAQTLSGRPMTPASSTAPKSVIASSPAQMFFGRPMTFASSTAPKSAIASSPAQILPGRPMTVASSTTGSKSATAFSNAQMLGRTMTTASRTAASKTAIPSSPAQMSPGRIMMAALSGAASNTVAPSSPAQLLSGRTMTTASSTAATASPSPSAQMLSGRTMATAPSTAASKTASPSSSAQMLSGRTMATAPSTAASKNTSPSSSAPMLSGRTMATAPSMASKTVTPSPAQMLSGSTGTIPLSKEPSSALRPNDKPSNTPGAGFAAWNSRPNIGPGSGISLWDARNGHVNANPASGNALPQVSSRTLTASTFAELLLQPYIPTTPKEPPRPVFPSLTPQPTASPKVTTTQKGPQQPHASSSKQPAAQEGSPRKRGRPRGSGWRQKAEAKRVEVEREGREAEGLSPRPTASQPVSQPMPKPKKVSVRLTPVKNGHWSPPKASSPVAAPPKTFTFPSSKLKAYGEVPTSLNLVRLSSFRPALNGARISHWSPAPTKSPDEASPSGSEPNSTGSGSGTGHDSADSASAVAPSDAGRQSTKTTPVKAVATSLGSLSGSKWHSPTANKVISLAGNGIMVGGKRVRLSSESSSEPDPKKPRPPYRASTPLRP